MTPVSAHAAWLHRLAGDDACAIDESLAMLAECALRDGSAAAAAAAAPAAAPARGAPEALVYSSFADGFSLPFVQWEARSSAFSESVYPRDLTYAGSLLGHVFRSRASTDRLSALGPLLRLLRAYAGDSLSSAAAASAGASSGAGAGAAAGAGADAGAGAVAAPSAAVVSAPSSIRGASTYACQALVALAGLLGAAPGATAAAADAPAVGGAGAPPARPAALDTSPEEATRRAGWALELASMEAFDALTTVLEAAASGALPEEAAASVHAVASRLAGDPQLVAAVRGAADNVRAETGRATNAAVQRMREATHGLVPVSMHVRVSADEGLWDAAIEAPPMPPTERMQPCCHGDLITIDSNGTWEVAVPLVISPEGRARMAWVSCRLRLARDFLSSRSNRGDGVA